VKTEHALIRWTGVRFWTAPAVHAQASEHILLQSEVREVPEPGRARITHAALRCRSRLRMRRLELAIIDYYYLAVRTSRTGSVREYVLDLRFLDRSIRATRHIPWRCILVTLALASVAAVSIRQTVSSTALWWHQHQLLLCATTLGLTACAGLVSAWRTTETFSLRSLHGGATLLEFTGGPGTLRASRRFARKLAAHIQFAVADRRATKGEHLRDEMREHFRLREAGVLSQQQYEFSKAQILAQHAPVRGATQALSWSWIWGRGAEPVVMRRH
jgi:hypothetical protein